MPMRSLVATLLLLPLATITAHAQSYSLKLKGAPAAGKSVSVDENVKVTIAFSVSLDNNLLMEDKKVVKELKQYTEKVIEADDNGPKKFSRTYTKAAKGEGEAPEALSYAGKTIIFERKGDKFEGHVEGGGVDEKELHDLLKSVNNKAKDPGFVPKNAVKVGDTWPLGKEALGSFLGDLKDGADFTKFKGQGKLVKAYQKAGQQWGTLELTVFVPVKRVGPLELGRTIPFEMKLLMDSPIDGSSSASQITGTLTVKGKSEAEANGQTVMLDIAVEAQFRRDQTAEK